MLLCCAVAPLPPLPRWRRERSELEGKLREQLEGATARAAEAERDARALREQKYGLDAQVSELSHRLGAAEGGNRCGAEPSSEGRTWRAWLASALRCLAAGTPPPRSSENTAPALSPSAACAQGPHRGGGAPAGEHRGAGPGQGGARRGAGGGAGAGEGAREGAEPGAGLGWSGSESRGRSAFQLVPANSLTAPLPALCPPLPPTVQVASLEDKVSAQQGLAAEQAQRLRDMEVRRWAGVAAAG